MDEWEDNDRANHLRYFCSITRRLKQARAAERGESKRTAADYDIGDLLCQTGSCFRKNVPSGFSEFCKLVGSAMEMQGNARKCKGMQEEMRRMMGKK